MGEAEDRRRRRRRRVVEEDGDDDDEDENAYHCRRHRPRYLILLILAIRPIADAATAAERGRCILVLAIGPASSSSTPSTSSSCSFTNEGCPLLILYHKRGCEGRQKQLGEPGTGGSSTPSMVGAVEQWQKSDPQKSQETWKRLAEANSMLETQFKILSQLAEQQWEVYRHTIISCSSHTHEKWIEQATDQHQKAVIKSLMGAREAFLQIRFFMQQMGKAAGVPIEPESQTHLLDATMNLEGVLLAGVPGAGGFDAVFAITLGDANTRVIQAWSTLGVLPLLVKEDPRGVSLESGDPRTQEVSSAISSINIE